MGEGWRALVAWPSWREEVERLAVRPWGLGWMLFRAWEWVLSRLVWLRAHQHIVVVQSVWITCVQATVRLAAGSVYLVRLGSGLAGKLGASCCGAGVASSAIVADVLQWCGQGIERWG